jgi:uncharacterized protein YndB with AHSA1/START domain
MTNPSAAAAPAPNPDDVVTVERVIPAPPEKIFDLLADPGRHRDFDGSGTVRDPEGPAQRLALGSKFNMKMKMGIPYTMVNTVIEFEDNKRIAWQPRPATWLGRNFGGRIWRYQLDPVDGGTRVRESWDISQERGMKSLVRRAGKHTADAMTKTLERIQEIVTQ